MATFRFKFRLWWDGEWTQGTKFPSIWVRHPFMERHPFMISFFLRLMWCRYGTQAQSITNVQCESRSTIYTFKLNTQSCGEETTSLSTWDNNQSAFLLYFLLTFSKTNLSSPAFSKWIHSPATANIIFNSNVTKTLELITETFNNDLQIVLSRIRRGWRLRLLKAFALHIRLYQC